MATEATLNRPSPGPEPRDLAVPVGMRRVRFPAMGTSVSLLLPERQAEVAGAEVRGLFELWEKTLSRFQPESELSRLNRRAGTLVPVGALLWDALVTALDAAQATDGLYDPTLLRPLVALGYDRSFDEFPATAPAHCSSRGGTPPRVGGWRDIYLDRRQHRVMLPPGVGLDLGGLAKGQAVDTALAVLQARGVEAALVNAGGDLAVCGSPPHGDAWPIAVEGIKGAWSVPLQRGAMATSGIARRRWQRGGETRHHLLDPRTGRPAQRGLWSVSVVAAHCVQAEAAATAAFVLGPDDGRRFLEERGLSGLFAGADGAWQVAGAWPAAREGYAQ